MPTPPPLIHIPHPTNPSIFASTSPLLLTPHIPLLHTHLKSAYWCPNLPFPVLLLSIENSLPLALYHQSTSPQSSTPESNSSPGETELIGFSRWITDYATFGYVSDVIVFPEWRGQGLGGWLMKVGGGMRCLEGCRRLLLMTRGAGFYENLELEEEKDEGAKWKVIWPDSGIAALEVKRNVGRLYGVEKVSEVEEKEVGVVGAEDELKQG